MGLGQENLLDFQRGIKDHWISCSEPCSRLCAPFIVFESFYNLVNCGKQKVMQIIHVGINTNRLPPGECN